MNIPVRKSAPERPKNALLMTGMSGAIAPTPARAERALTRKLSVIKKPLGHGPGGLLVPQIWQWPKADSDLGAKH